MCKLRKKELNMQHSVDSHLVLGDYYIPDLSSILAFMSCIPCCPLIIKRKKKQSCWEQPKPLGMFSESESERVLPQLL